MASVVATDHGCRWPEKGVDFSTGTDIMEHTFDCMSGGLVGRTPAW
jgi:hypothetical protein